MAQRNISLAGFVCALSLMGMAGCSSVNSLLESDRIDYKSAAGKSSTPALEIPPDLTQMQRDNRYALPTSAGSVTATGYQQQQAAQPTTTTVAPKGLGADIRIERAGNQRWLVIKKSPEVLWPQIKDFWQDSGFLINIEQPDAGVMETDWAENRAKIPQDLIRRTLGKYIDSLYSTGELDKFRTRLERNADGSTEIFISHRGAQEELVGAGKERTVWTPRPSDPELEAEFLSRLMVRLGMEGERAKVVMAKAAQSPSHAKLIKGASGKYVEIDEGFDRVWRRVGLALDRVGFTVEDRDRSQGVYFVRYVDQDKIAQEKAAKEKGLLSKWFSFGSDDKDKAAKKYRISVKATGQSSQVTVLGNDGKPESSPIGDSILSLLHDQLK
jgi:outer membrane protein assembly factor BamC